jgi:hypothetical protein
MSEIKLDAGEQDLLTSYQHATTNKGSIWAIIWLNLPLMLILIALVTMFASESHGVVNVSVERVAFLCGLYLALPSGVLSIVLVIRALSRGVVKKSVAVIRIILGIVSILIGLLSWTWLFMVSSFVSAHGG